LFATFLGSYRLRAERQKLHSIEVSSRIAILIAQTFDQRPVVDAATIATQVNSLWGNVLSVGSLFIIQPNSEATNVVDEEQNQPGVCFDGGVPF
jgi:hypothetical protein